MQNLIIAARCDIYTLFRNLLASAFLGTLVGQTFLSVRFCFS